MKMIRRIALCVAGMMIAATAAAQTAAPLWVNVGTGNNYWTASAPATFRFGYPDSTGTNWVTLQVSAGELPSYANGSQVPPAADALSNPQGVAFEVDVLQSGTAVTVEEGDVWGGGGTGCYTTVTYTIPASGAVTSSQSACPGQTPPPVITPPVTTPPVITPPVTTPPVTTTLVTTTPVTTPPVTIPIGPVTITLPASTSLPLGCASGLVSGTDASGNAAGSYFYILCSNTPSQ